MFKVKQIDHIHVFVSDQYEAATWYEKTLGLDIIGEYEDWASDGGPLTVSSDGGNTSVALFRQREKRAANQSTIAFRVEGSAFLLFLEGLAEMDLRDREGKRVSRDAVSDHDRSYSIYFCDPDGNPIEITTYDYEVVRGSLESTRKEKAIS